MALPNGTDTTRDTTPVITTTRLLADLQVYGYPELKVSGTADGQSSTMPRGGEEA